MIDAIITYIRRILGVETVDSVVQDLNKVSRRLENLNAAKLRKIEVLKVRAQRLESDKKLAQEAADRSLRISQRVDELLK